MEMDIGLFGDLRCKCGRQLNVGLVERCCKDDSFVAGRAFVAVDDPWSRLRFLLSDAGDLKIN